MAAEIDFREGFDVEEVSQGKVRVSLDLAEVADQLPDEHPDLAEHNALGLATDAELAAHAATSHGGTHPDLATHNALGLATDTEVAAHAGAADPHADRAWATTQFMRKVPTGFPVQYVDNVWGSDTADGDSEGAAKLTVAAALAGLSLNYGRLFLPPGQELTHNDKLIVPQGKSVIGYGPQGAASGGSTLKYVGPDDGRPAVQWGPDLVTSDVSHGLISGVRLSSQANANGWGLDARNLQNMTRLSRVFVTGFTKTGIKVRDIVSDTDWVYPGFVGFDRVWVTGGTEVHFDIEAGFSVMEFRLCGSDPRAGALKAFYVHNKHNLSTSADLATAAVAIKFILCKVETNIPAPIWILEQNGEVELDGCSGFYGEGPCPTAAVTWDGPLVTTQGVVVTEPPVKIKNFISQGYAKGFAAPDFPEEDIPLPNTAGVFSSFDYKGKDHAPTRWTGVHPAMTLDDSLTIQPKSAVTRGLHVTPRSDQVAASAVFDGFLVNEAFTRADSASSIGGSWSSPLRGTWGISSNKGYLPSVTDEALVTYPGLTADGTLEVAVTASSVAARCFAGLCLRVNNSNNYLRYTINGQLGELDLKMISVGVGSTLKTANMTVVPGQTYVLKVELDGLTIRCYLDGVLQYTHVLTAGTQAGFLTQAEHGLHSNRTSVQDDGGSRWDNFKFSAAALSVDPAGLIHWVSSINQQTTVGAAGAASALPATPTKYLRVVDSSGAVLVIPAYLAS